ncbi:MAG: M1 family aminopeptidase [Acidobacteriota bacterium]|nr:M1 family aminopeptidase [Acidobacteriota bacterium]
MGRHRRASWLALLAIAATSSAADPGDYEALSAWRFSSVPVALAGEVSWQRDTAIWTLSSGRIQVLEPTADGTATGFVFEGQGRFEMTIPDRFELAQLRRFAGDEGLERLEYSFSKLVVRGSRLQELPLDLAPPASFDAHALARRRHESWLRQALVDVDARVLEALANPGAEYLRLDMLTAQDGWVCYEYDSERLEEIRIQTPRQGGARAVRRPGDDRDFQTRDLVESWVSLDRPQDRAADGRPTYREQGPLDLAHVEVAATLGGLGKGVGGARGRTQTHSRKTRFEVVAAYEARRSNLRALRFFLHPYAAVEEVRDGEGRPLELLRRHIGAAGGFDERLHDPALTVFLNEPTVAGETVRLEFAYELEISNFVMGASWYPTSRAGGSGLVDVHTARIAVTGPEGVAVLGMGRREGESVEGDLKTTIFRVERPAKMVAFTLAERPLEERIAVAGVPEVVVVSSGQGMHEDMLHDTGANLASSLGYFQDLFASPLPIERLTATLIAAGHGQAFDGMLHLSDATGLDSSATVPFFRAHEVAHQWWGHLVGWKTYRDQWLSEGFAEYSAMLYMGAVLDGGDKLFLEALRVSRDEITGSLKTAFSRFFRPYQALLNQQAAKRIGPIGHGSRANVADSPGAYSSLAYKKGAYVLHMLRGTLRGRTGSDDVFFDVLRDFLAAYRGKPASTDDFKAVLAARAPADWDWFFDQWVYGAAVPTYSWAYGLEGGTADGQVRVVLRVRQTEVPAGFKMPLPVRAELAGGRTVEMMVMVDRPEMEIPLTLPARPKKLELNPDNAVLARMKKL